MDRNRKETPRARIAWISPIAGSCAEAAPSFEKAGYALIEPEARERIDVAVVDFRARRVSAKAAQRLAALIRRKAPECGIVYLGSPLLAAAERAHLRRTGDLILTEDDLRPAVEACRQRLRIRNIAEEAGERLKTIAALTRLSEFPPIDASGAPPSVLVAGAAGPGALAVLGAAEMVGKQCAGAFSAAQAMRALETNAFDCAVFLPAGMGDPLIGLARAMRRHRRFRDTAVLLAASDEALRARLAASWGSDVIGIHHAREDLPARLVSATRRARLIAAMRRFLSACAGEGVRDRLSGGFTSQFFGQHAQRVFARADQTGRSDSLVGLRLAPLAEGAAGEPRTLTEAARLVNRVTRAEDCVGRLSRDTFVVLMSATTAADAAIAARRIEGVIGNTMFRARGREAPFPVAAATAVVERAAGMGLEETIAGVLSKLNAAKPRTAQR